MAVDLKTFLAGAAAGAAAGASVAVALSLWRRRTLPPRGALRAHAPMATAGVLSAGNVAVIFGSASGIGRAAALRCASLKMKICLCDIEVNEAKAVADECAAAGAQDTFVQKCDVRLERQVLMAQQLAFKKWGKVHLLMNNAAVQTNGRCGPYEHPDRWKRILETNLGGVYHGCLAFVPPMIAQGEAAVVVNTGSKQGITAPPGDTAYNVSKAGVKVLTEALQHKLRTTADCKVNAFLLVPGFTATMINTRGDKWVEGDAWKPESARNEREYDGVQDVAVAAQKFAARGAWPASRVVDELFAAIDAGGPFYVLCEDGETTAAQDNGRMQWAADDLIFRRAPLSRWSDEFKEEYKRVAAGF